MFDGSMLSMDENLERTKAVVEFAKRFNVSVEAEVGAIGGEEDGIASAGVISNVSDALKMKETGIDVLACWNRQYPWQVSWIMKIIRLRNIKQNF